MLFCRVIILVGTFRGSVANGSVFVAVVWVVRVAEFTICRSTYAWLGPNMKAWIDNFSVSFPYKRPYFYIHVGFNYTDLHVSDRARVSIPARLHDIVRN